MKEAVKEEASAVRAVRVLVGCVYLVGRGGIGARTVGQKR